MSPDKEFADIGLTEVIADLLRGTAPEDAPVFAWPVVCGRAVATHTRALLFLGGVLRIGVPDQGWRMQLLGLEGRYVQQYKKILGSDRVRHIEFVIMPPHA